MSRLLLHLKNVNPRRVRIIAFALLISLTCVVSCYADQSDRVLPDQVASVSTEVLRISASDASGFHAVILGLLGDYNPIVKDYTYQSTQGYTNHSIEIQPDWSWISSAAIFLVIIFCVFRLIGGLFSWKR